MSDLKNEKFRSVSDQVEVYKFRIETLEQIELFQRNEITSLITTIESQNSQIESLKAITESKIRELATLNEAHHGWLKAFGNYEEQIKSLKAITKLAVKGLKFYASFWNHEVQLEDVGITSMKRDGGKMARTTLSEIEKLQNG